MSAVSTIPDGYFWGFSKAGVSTLEFAYLCGMLWRGCNKRDEHFYLPLRKT